MTALPTLGQQMARQEVRRCSRALKRDATNVSAHLARIHAALELPGSEAIQGALTDVFVVFGDTQSTLKRASLTLAKNRLAEHVVRWFSSQVDAPALAKINSLATRWSVLAVPSADISTRARRCSADDSRLLASQVLEAIERQDKEAEQAFLHHCVTCHDNLAFMLARRVMLRTGLALPVEWDQVSQQLEQSMESACI